MKEFNPNDVCSPNGQFFGFPFSIEQAALVLYSVPWDVTTSYRAGTSNGPQSILNASYQMDYYDSEIEQAWNLGVATFPLDQSKNIKRSNEQLRRIAEKIINSLSEDQTSCNKQANSSSPIHTNELQSHSPFDFNHDDYQITQMGVQTPTYESLEEDLFLINQASEILNETVYNQTKEWIKQGKKVGLVGGDHSCPLGYIKALSEFYPSFGILHIDAHADLRIAYEGFVYSHASIMYNAVQIPEVTHLVQVGIRDYCQQEAQYAHSNPKITQFTDNELLYGKFQGCSWHKQCEMIIKNLPSHVYISFDIDGLDPNLCPHTGTPVPGGLTYHQAIYLLRILWKSNKTIIGFDLCEVGEDPQGDWDGNVGARILFLLSCISLAKPPIKS